MLEPRGTKAFKVLLLALISTACCSRRSNDEMSEFDAYRNALEVAPVESQAGPVPTVIPGVQDQNSTPELDPSMLVREFERRQRILVDKMTQTVVQGTVTGTRAFQWENPEAEWSTGRKPQWEIFTRVTLEVEASFKKRTDEKVIEFWSRCGKLDQNDWQSVKPGSPLACVNTADASFLIGDKVIVALQDHKPLPDGQAVLRLRGSRRGATFLNSNNENERAVAQRILQYLSNSSAIH
ncbi:MAG TPA: hypothetical protein PK668_09605 [Myxococcota bacterium]|nr:hypothetical protein [Myxococcota bacterium]HRY92762.1 hypothetical protein [Myxococcota bacterium]